MKIAKLSAELKKRIVQTERQVNDATQSKVTETLRE